MLHNPEVTFVPSGIEADHCDVAISAAKADIDANNQDGTIRIIRTMEEVEEYYARIKSNELTEAQGNQVL
jgi:hypothetical protein